MKLVYLETSTLGLRWFKQYYVERPELNWEEVQKNFVLARERIKQDVYAGHSFDTFPTVRELRITKTPFSILFTHKNQTIYIIDIHDQRGLRSATALNAHIAELKRKHELI